MEYRALGATGLRVSALGIGTWQLAGPLLVDGAPDGFPDPGRAAAIRLIHAAADLGVNLIDTAPIYGGGEGERRAGAALAGRRDRFTVVAKFGLSVDAAGRRAVDPSAAALEASLEASLARMALEHVDVLLWHSPPTPGQLEAGVEVLLRLVAAGRVRAFGISTAIVADLDRVLASGGTVAMFPYSLASRDAALPEVIVRRGAGGLLRGALAGGRLSGKWFGAPPAFAADDLRRHSFRAGDVARYAAFRELVPAGVDPAAFAYRFALDAPGVGSVVCGARDEGQLRIAASALDLPHTTAATRAAAEEIRARVFAAPARPSLLRRLAARLLR